MKTLVRRRSLIEGASITIFPHCDPESKIGDDLLSIQQQILNALVESHSQIDSK